MNEMNILTLNGEQYEVADKVARESKADKSYVDEKLALKADSTSLNGKVDKSPIGAAMPDDTQEVHLTPEGKLVTKPTGSGGGSDINDSAIATDSTWSSKKLAETFAPVVPVTMTGIAVSTDIVSPVEHDVECKTESKNILSTETLELLCPGGAWGIEGDEVIYQGTAWNSQKTVFPLKKGTKLSLTSEYNNLTVSFIPYNDSPEWINLTPNKTITLTVETEKIVFGGTKDGVHRFHVMLSKTSFPQKYTPYISDLSAVTVTQNPGGKTFKPNAAGVVTGMKSLFPSMTILTDNPGAIIEITYNADTKKYIESQGGGGSGAGYHNSVYRGKNLGASVSDEQYTRIKNGTFENLYIGDYWTIGDVKWRIASFDYFLNTGDTKCTEHHVVMVPDTGLYKSPMNNSSTTNGGYVGSTMYSSGLTDAKNTIKSAFSNHVLNHRILLTNAVSGGVASGVIWSDSEVDLMDEQMVFGSGIYSPVSDGTKMPTNQRIEKSQLSLFAFRPDLISSNLLYWLRDVISDRRYVGIGSEGAIDEYGPTTSDAAVRPYFCIYGGV